MFERSKYKKKYLDLKRPIWKILDDYSGAYIYSNEMVIDYRGFVTKKGQEVLEPDAEHPVPAPKEIPPFDRNNY